MGGSGFGAGASLGLGAGLGTVDALSMLAHVFWVPSGMTLGFCAVVVAAGAAAAAAAASVPVVSHAVSSEVFVVSQASSVGTESCCASLGLCPFVVAAEDLPRAARPPRSVALPRPRPPSERPPRVCLVFAVDEASVPVVVVNVSFALDFERSFFCLETSPHCEMVPGAEELG